MDPIIKKKPPYDNVIKSKYSITDNDERRMQPLYDSDDQNYYKSPKSTGGDFKAEVSNLSDIMGSNLLFNMDKANWYRYINRYGWIDPYDHDRFTREYLFFTKPDCNLFSGGTIYGSLNDDIATNPIISDVHRRHPQVLGQLSLSANDGYNNPFMYLLSNSVISKLDLPNITVENLSSTPNIMGTTIDYRGHSFKGGGYDFSLQFHDTQYLEVYLLAKCYDEYIKMIRLGDAAPKHDYIVNHILSDQFSIYKFVVGSDGETILYYAKLTGCYFTDVPRDIFGEPPDDGLKLSLSFHAHFVEDMNPYIIHEFKSICDTYFTSGNRVLPVFDDKILGVNNTWAEHPNIIIAGRSDPTYGKRVARRNSTREYFLKWYK